jgi:hypothetical protein
MSNLKRIATPKKNVNRHGLTKDQTEHLILGYNLITPRERPFASDEERRRAWFAHKDFIMSYMGKQLTFDCPGFPVGTRPHAWWAYEAPETRRGSGAVQNRSDKNCFSVCQNTQAKKTRTQISRLSKCI